MDRGTTKPTPNPELKCYFVRTKTDPSGLAIVATSVREAKRLIWNDPIFKLLEIENWTNLRVTWLRGIDVTGLERGSLIYGIDGLTRGVFDSVEDICPICDKFETIIREPLDTGDVVIGCHDCVEAEFKKRKTGKR